MRTHPFNDSSNFTELIKSKPNPDILIGTTGSSGRGEKYAEYDDFELIIFGETLCNIRNKLESVLGDDFLLEFKEYLSPAYYEGENKIFFPSRFLDFKLLSGDTEMLHELTTNFVSNILNSTKSEIKGWKSRIAYHRGISMSGRGKWRSKHFNIYDEQKKVLYYEKSDETEISIKIGPLRYMQYIYTLLVLTGIKQSKIGEIDLIHLGKSMDEKLDFMYGYLSNFSVGELNQLKSLYTYFVNLHNLMIIQHGFKGSGHNEMTDSDFSMFQENLTEVNELISNIRKSFSAK